MQELPNGVAGNVRLLADGDTVPLPATWSCMMGATNNPEPIRIGLLADEPIRLEGLTTIFESHPGPDTAPIFPVTATIHELLADITLRYVVVDLNSSTGRMATIQAIRAERPEIRLIVIGPEGDDELVMDLVVAGARAYLDLKASPETVRQAIEVVTSGSIWAPRRLLSRLIDRLLHVPQPSPAVEPALHLTSREVQVQQMILQACSNREIARRLGIEERTVKAHVSRLMRKTGATNRIGLSLHALNKKVAADG
jgi:DNA-binding NarL/FixJ family response regulator